VFLAALASQTRRNIQIDVTPRWGGRQVLISIWAWRRTASSDALGSGKLAKR